MALSEKTVNRHNIRRAEIFKQHGLNTLDIQYAHPRFEGFDRSGGSECILCGKKHLLWLFSIYFKEPQGLVALAKIETDIDRDTEVTLNPVGSKCITDWLDAVPETAEKLEVLKRWAVEMARMKDAMKAKVIEDLCQELGFGTPEDAEVARKEVYSSYRNIQAALTVIDRWASNRLQKKFRKIVTRKAGRALAKTLLTDLRKAVDAVKALPAEPIATAAAPSTPATPPAGPPALSPDDQALLARGAAALLKKPNGLISYRLKDFQEIEQKVRAKGGFASIPQRRYYSDLVRMLEKP